MSMEVAAWTSLHKAMTAQQERRPFSMVAVRGAEKVRISATEPSGAIVQTECASSPCAVAVDGRQGKPLIEVIYLSNSEGVLARTASPL